MMFVQKLPALEPKMRGALRSHIIKKRRRLKQELEQDAIEKRMKKERELKKIQDEMTLDQIKEQLQVLEKRLESLKSEKHDLFVQLKQVLNDKNSSSRKKPVEQVQNDANQQPQQPHLTSSKSQNERLLVPLTENNERSSSNNHSSQRVSFAPLNDIEAKSFSQPIPSTPSRPMPPMPLSSSQPTSSSSSSPSSINKKPNQTSHLPTAISRVQNFLPQPGVSLAQATNISASAISMDLPYFPPRPLSHMQSSSLANYKVSDFSPQFRANSSLTGRSDMNLPLPFDFASQRLRFSHNPRPLLMDLPVSLVSGQRDSLNDFTKNGLKRPSSVANSSAADLIEERLYSKKRPIAITSQLPSSPRYSNDRIMQRGFHQYSNLLTSTSSSPQVPMSGTFTSMPSAVPNIHQSQYFNKSLPPNPQIPPSYNEFLAATSRQSSSFLTSTGFNPALYTSQLISSNARMPTSETDLGRHPDYHNLHLLPQQFTNTPRNLSSAHMSTPIDRNQRLNPRNTYGSPKTSRNNPQHRNP